MEDNGRALQIGALYDNDNPLANDFFLFLHSLC